MTACIFTSNVHSVPTWISWADRCGSLSVAACSAAAVTCLALLSPWSFPAPALQHTSFSRAIAPLSGYVCFLSTQLHSFWRPWRTNINVLSIFSCLNMCIPILILLISSYHNDFITVITRDVYAIRGPRGVYWREITNTSGYKYFCWKMRWV